MGGLGFDYVRFAEVADADRGRQVDLQNAQGDRGTGLWSDQGVAGIPSLQLPRVGPGGAGMEADLPDEQHPEAVPLGVVAGNGMTKAAKTVSRPRKAILRPFGLAKTRHRRKIAPPVSTLGCRDQNLRRSPLWS